MNEFIGTSAMRALLSVLVTLALTVPARGDVVYALAGQNGQPLPDSPVVITFQPPDPNGFITVDFSIYMNEPSAGQAGYADFTAGDNITSNGTYLNGGSGTLFPLFGGYPNPYSIGLADYSFSEYGPSYVKVFADYEGGTVVLENYEGTFVQVVPEPSPLVLGLGGLGLSGSVGLLRRRSAA